MGSKFQIIIGSPIEYDELVAYVVINGQHIALVSKDEGVDKLKISFFQEPLVKDIDYDVLIEALLEAKTELLK